MKSLVPYCAFAALIFVCSTASSAQKRRPPIRQTPPKIAAVPPKVVTNCPGSGLTDAEVADLLAAHNKQRLKVNTPPLRWDCSVAANSVAWARQGTPGHSDTSFGENIFVSSDPTDKVTKAVDQWEDEEHHWKNKRGECDAGKVCTHYAQIVWRSTTKVGCAVNRSMSGKWKLMLVCNYDPAALSGPAY